MQPFTTIRASSALTACLSLLLPPTSAAPDQPLGVRADCSAEDATQFSLQYGEPLLAYERAFRGRLSKNGINTMITSTELSSPQQTATVKPNFDTLYMSQCFDVSRQDIVLTIADLSNDKDRFWSASFYTAYGDNYLNIGSFQGGTTAGDYLLTSANTSETTGTMQKSDDPAYKGVIYASKTIGFLLIRIVLRDDNDDLIKVRNIQKGFGTRLVDCSGPSIGPELSVELFANASSQAEHILDLTSRFVGTNSLSNKTVAEIEQLSTAGIYDNGTYSKPPCITLEKSYQVASSRIKSYLDENSVEVGNGWTIPPDDKIGEYGGDYVARAAIARWGYLAMTPDVALYPRLKGLLTLQSNESYKLKFSSKPPLKAGGFWSITMYDDKGLLVPNRINRYAIGDRSNLSYHDGTSVYGEEAQRASEGPFEVLIQGVQPPSGWISNWLPSPQNATRFELMLRFYLPDSKLINSEWEDPVLQKAYALLNEKHDNDSDSSEPIRGTGTKSNPFINLRYFVSVHIAIIVASIV